MTETVDVTAESSPAPAAPAQSEALPDFRSFRESENRKALGKPKTAEPAPAKETSAEGDEPKEKAAPASEAGKDAQDKGKPRSTAETRLQELLADLKRAGMTPAELKTFKREVQRQDAATSKAEPPKVEQPKQEAPKKLEAPKKPVWDDYAKDGKTFEEFEAAKDRYYEDLADFKAVNRLNEWQKQQAEAREAEKVQQQVNAAVEHYGAEAGGAISAAVDAIMQSGMPQAVQAVINDSPVFAHLLYVAGQDPAALAEFVALSKSNPTAALRKVVAMETAIQQELSKGSKSESETVRDDSGKFVSHKQPEKPSTKAPPIGTEVSGRSSAPPDPLEAAVKNGDFRTFREIENRKALDRRR